MRRTLENQIETLTAMKAEFSRAIDEAIAALYVIEERAKTQEWLDYAEEYGFEEDDLMDAAFTTLDDMEYHYDEAYAHLYIDDIAYLPLEKVL